MTAKLVLASSSPRRLELLRQIALVPDIIASPDVDETQIKNEKPAELALRLAVSKAETVFAKHTDAFVIGGDTVVACGRRMLPKCADEAEVARCLTFLSGRRHSVYGGLCVLGPNGKRATRVVETAVTFRRLHADDIKAYAACGEGVGKAGGYAIQGRAAVFIKSINGSPSNVIGLPLGETAQLLYGLGYGAK